MREDKFIILAIAPGSREIGWAILQETKFMRCGVKTITKRHYLPIAGSEIHHFLKTLVKRYQPGSLIIEKRRLIQKSSGILAIVVKEAKAIATENQLTVAEYLSTTVRQRICQNEKGTKKKVAALLVSRYPELKNFLQPENKWSRLYYAKMFDALAVAVISRQDLSKTR